jgi:molybdopterin synthase catalytic subunit
LEYEAYPDMALAAMLEICSKVCHTMCRCVDVCYALCVMTILCVCAVCCVHSLYCLYSLYSLYSLRSLHSLHSLGRTNNLYNHTYPALFTSIPMTTYDIRHTTHDITCDITYDIRHTTYNLQPTTYNLQPTTYNLQHTTYNIQHKTYNIPHTTQARAQWSLIHIRIQHKLGPCPISDTSIAVVISSEHRKDSLEAIRFAIDELKSTVPIWKKVRSGETGVL